ncbi:MAG: iron ABC transporter permease [Rhodocyclaceae bacterium]|nr:iron ABC transporter permease [Rhodocyclaceae bacterium]
MSGLAAAYRRFSFLRQLLLAALALALLASLVADVATGPSRFPLADVWRGLVDAASLSPAQAVILWDVRLPYAVMAVFVGASLGLAGAEMQTVLNNPLASPFTLGVSAAATFGASLAIVLGFDLFGLGQHLAIPFLAFLFAAAATLLIQALARSYGATVDTVVLFGIALLFTFEALGWLLQFIADSDALQQIVFWTMGSLARATWPKIAVVATVFAVCLAFSLRQVWVMTALRGGEEQARSFGVAVERLRLIVLLRVSLLAAAALAFVGTIGFVGLVGPHIARLLLGEDHRFFLPGAALAGALMLSLASIASKSLIPGVVLPIGIVTALVGVPLFMALILGRRRRG